METKELFPLREKNIVKARALYLGERIDTKTLETTSLLAAMPLTFNVRDFGLAVVFKYGVIVLFEVDSIEEIDFLGKVKELISKPFDKPEIEEVEIRIDGNIKEEGIITNNIFISQNEVKRFQVIAEILAKNVVLSHYEMEVSANFDSIEPIAEMLKEKSKLTSGAKELVKHIGISLLHLHKMVARVEVTEKPELLWDYPELERFYSRLEDEFELQERHKAVERKIELISRTAETVLDLLQTQRGLRVEWYIVILIVVEIMFTIYDMFIRNIH